MLRTKRNYFSEGEAGGITIEYVLWLPFFLALILFFVDVSLTMSAHARMYDAARDAARAIVTGKSTASEASADAISLLQGAGSFIVNVDSSASDRVVVFVTGDNVGINGSPFDIFRAPTLQARYVMRKEGV
ncbi:TadE/TadG family type IV pilus assembly protein [Candidatus Rhodobacter oscarellae]|uniref:TadE/TadG family type IV pilus assembly protein n=1 Tax=Candidatus Rhodobacter oscarellae TaxID=1675527 RepID=UPI000A6C7B69|nr:TadE/TadG family type IV pilus assembly protein [Candidatus Rhodobacter lobularis]